MLSAAFAPAALMGLQGGLNANSLSSYRPDGLFTLQLQLHGSPTRIQFASGSAGASLAFSGDRTRIAGVAGSLGIGLKMRADFFFAYGGSVNFRLGVPVQAGVAAGMFCDAEIVQKVLASPQVTQYAQLAVNLKMALGAIPSALYAGGLTAAFGMQVDLNALGRYPWDSVALPAEEIWKEV
jgi:hypothetical protein